MASEGRTADARRAALRLGASAEDRVVEQLEAEGWEILARNWRGGGGELDVVALRDGRLRMVEVKARDPGDPLGPLESVTRAKQRRLRGAAEAWLLTAQVPDHDEVCFLVATVVDGRVELYDDPFAV